MILRRPEDVGLLVRDRRQAAGWSQAALAAEVGSSRQWVVELERGNAGAEIGRVLRVFTVLGVSLDAVVAASGAFLVPSLDELLGERPTEPPLGDLPSGKEATDPATPGASKGRAVPKRAARKAR